METSWAPCSFLAHCREPRRCLQWRDAARTQQAAPHGVMTPSSDLYLPLLAQMDARAVLKGSQHFLVHMQLPAAR